MTSIAFIGLGHMGAPMAANLVKAGHEVRGFDLVPELRDAARAAGVEIAESSADAAASADVIITMLPAGRHVLSVYGTVDDPGLLHAARPGTLFIDSSTIAFMVGGSDEDFEAARPLLEAMGRRVVHCGGAGLGQAAKVCNNMILAVSQIAVAEAFVLGERLGLSHQALFDVASNASGQCWALTTNCPVPGPVPTSPANRDYQPGFAGALMNKDLGLAEQAIELTGVDAKLGLLARAIYADFADGPGAEQDFSGIINTIRDESKDAVPPSAAGA